LLRDMYCCLMVTSKIETCSRLECNNTMYIVYNSCTQGCLWHRPLCIYFDNRKYLSNIIFHRVFVRNHRVVIIMVRNIQIVFFQFVFQESWRLTRFSVLLSSWIEVLIYSHYKDYIVLPLYFGTADSKFGFLTFF
jgi:hypothetical protein